MTERCYEEWRDFYLSRLMSWMSLEELRAECGKLTTTDGTSPELLLIHAMHALEEYVQRDEALLHLAALLVDELDGLVGESDGVSGLHLNGDVATWDELLPGGRFERLSSLDELRAASAQQPAAVDGAIDKARFERDEALLRQALEALEFFRDTAICESDTAVATEAIAALRERLGEGAEP